MEGEVISALLVYGPLGVISALAVGFAVKIYRDIAALRSAHDAALASMRLAHDTALTALRAQQDAERKAWEERYVAKAESWMERYHELARDMNAVLEALEKRYSRNGG